MIAGYCRNAPISGVRSEPSAPARCICGGSLRPCCSSRAPVDRRAEIEGVRAIHEHLFVFDRLLPESRLGERAHERLLRFEMQLGNAVEPPHTETRTRGGAPRRGGVDVELHVA